MRSVKAFVLLFFSLSTAWARSDYVDEPKGCLSSEDLFPCGVRVLKKASLKTKNFVLRMESGSSFLLSSSKEIAVLDGVIYLKAQDLSRIKISQTFLEFTGELLVEKHHGRELRFYNLAAAVSFPSSPFWMKSEALPEGFENWYAGLAPSGVLQRGVLRPFVIPQMAAKVFSLGGWSQPEASSSWKHWRELWLDTVESGAELYQDTTKMREVASLEKKRQKALRAERERQEKAEIRRLYREKALFR